MNKATGFHPMDAVCVLDGMVFPVCGVPPLGYDPLNR